MQTQWYTDTRMVSRRPKAYFLEPRTDMKPDNYQAQQDVNYVKGLPISADRELP